MKKVLITGAGSYIGLSLEKWLGNYEGYQVDTLDMLDQNWKKYNFTGYDTVVHVAGIAHSDQGKLSVAKQHQYYKINRDLTIETAMLAKKSGVKQFIFMSSMIVYNSEAVIGKIKIITNQTKPSPSNYYGDSKLQAEKGLLALREGDFHVAILRSPMIYGKGCKGNYQRLASLAKKIPFFPNINNRRSMIYIKNLCEFIHLVIEKECAGIFLPQNAEYVSTSQMVKMIAKVTGKKLFLSKFLGIIVQLCSWIPGKPKSIINKVFGSVIYKQTNRNDVIAKEAYQVRDLYSSIKETET